MNIKKEFRRLRELYSSYWASRVLQVAVAYEVFEHLQRPLGPEALCRRLGSSERATPMLLDALVALGLLRKDREGRYQNAPISSRFLLKASPYYQGHIIRHSATLWHRWGHLEEVIRTGRPPQVERDHRSFILGMHSASVLKAPQVLRAIGLRGVRRALDLGGGPGTYSRLMANRGIQSTLLDLPETIKVARPLLRGTGVRLRAGDFFHTSLGRGYDLVLISQVLHAYGAQDCLRLLGRAREALAPGGRVAVHEFYINRRHTAPLRGALFSINMLLSTQEGRCYSPQELKGFLREAGLSPQGEHRLEDTVVITAAKK